MRTRTLLILPLLILALAIGGCSSGGDGAVLEARGPGGPGPSSTAPSGTADSTTDTTQPPTSALVATASTTEVTAYTNPDEGADVQSTFGQSTGFGSPTTFLVVGGEGEWLEVLLPIRPNGTTGWVRSSDVSVSETDLQVVVDLGQRELAVLDGGDVVLQSPIAIGAPDAPTPTGLAYVTDLLETSSADNAYGPYAFGLSARSETYSEFAGGDGQIGIHGTDDPSSIGQAVSHGCIRLPNEVIAELAALLPLGTPVQIV